MMSTTVPDEQPDEPPDEQPDERERPDEDAEDPEEVEAREERKVPNRARIGRPVSLNSLRVSQRRVPGRGGLTTRYTPFGKRNFPIVENSRRF